MTGQPRADADAACPAHRRAAYAAATRPPVAEQIEELLGDLDRLRVVTSGTDPAAARGAALTTAYTALRLAVTPSMDEGERRRRRETLRGVAVPALERAGLGHVGGLVETALAHDADPAALTRGVETPQ